MFHTQYSILIVLLFLGFFANAQNNQNTIVDIKGESFYINGKPTYEGVTWQGHKIEGLLMNSRMVQGIFDDLNPETRERFKYPDTQKWDADRNTNEFIAAMDDWYAHGLLAVTVNLQGGSPLGYGNKAWVNSAFDEKGNLRPAYFERLDKILKKADDIGMVIILGYFYFGQDQNLEDEAAILNAVDNATNWLFEKGYRNVLIEVNNECDVKAYDHEILKPERVPELIKRVKKIKKNGYRYLVSTSYGGGSIPTPGVVKASDYILIHGNGVKDPNRITKMVEETKAVKGYKPMPIVFNEDDHYDFDKAQNNMAAAVKAYASWGYFDFRREGDPFEEGYQSVPVDWRISTERKKAFFNEVKEITGGL